MAEGSYFDATGWSSFIHKMKGETKISISLAGNSKYLGPENSIGSQVFVFLFLSFLIVVTILYH